MSSRNKTTRTVLRTHLVVGFLIGVLVYTPARDEAFALLMQAAVVPAVTLTGAWMWQQARLRHLYRRLRQSLRPDKTNGHKPTEETLGGTTVQQAQLNLVSEKDVGRKR